MADFQFVLTTLMKQLEQQLHGLVFLQNTPGSLFSRFAGKTLRCLETHSTFWRGTVEKPVGSLRRTIEEVRSFRRILKEKQSAVCRYLDGSVLPTDRITGNAQGHIAETEQEDHSR